ncbi:CheB methylesterase domain-containing protein [Antarctobacter sp.]|uniref:CheB methylesterase domain-containing protein n=1 Tax=Antarctobacter sp. TaxID=1872577 RepID=UPI003A8FF9EC
MPRKTVVIATPDRAQQARLGRLVDQMADFEVVSRTGDLMNTYNVVEERLPKAVLIADVLANLPEFEVMRALFATLDIRWLVVTMPNRSSRRSTAPVGFDKPGSDIFSIPADAPEEVYVRQLCALTRTDRKDCPAKKPLSSAPPPVAVDRPTAPRDVARTPPGRPITLPGAEGHGRHHAAPPRIGAIRASAAAQQVPAQQTPASRRSTLPVAPAGTDQNARASDSAGRMVLIGASTGGVDALLNVLSQFPEDCPPTLIVQHTGLGFGQSLAGLLNRQCLPNVLLATGPLPLRRGQILIGAGTRSHLVIEGRAGTRATCVKEDPVAGHIPSVDRLFGSAVPHAARVSAALLTGMGRDGADGMKALFAAGAFTIAQNEASCVVYGMPRAAVQNGSVHKILPLDRIAQALLREQGEATRVSREIH